MNKSIIAIYPAHDSSVTVYSNGEFRVFELERLKKQRFYRFDNQEDYIETYKTLKSIIKTECGVSSFDTCYCQVLPDSHKEYLINIFNIKEFVFVGHHISHAASSFYQSSFDNALVVSYDGGGFEGDDAKHRVSFFNFYIGNKKTGLELIHTVNVDLGTGYGMLSLPVSEIGATEENWGDRFLSFAGKFMGLSAYGNVREEWKPAIRDFYFRTKHHNTTMDFKQLSKSIGLSFEFDSLKGQQSYDLAATAQSVFQDIVLDEMKPFLDKYDLPVCLAGGCALNILLNQTLHEMLDRELFVPPNPSDCGLSFGMAALHIKPLNPPNLMYSGFPILDFDKLDKYVLSEENVVFATYAQATLSNLINDGKIVAIMNGNSEHGPRALGNRSILCDPFHADMKDTLNAKVKFREWFRPFAPMVRVEDVNKYFHFDRDSKYMSFSPRVREEYLDQIKAAVHVDGTSRVQTVNKEDNEFIHNLLTILSEEHNKGVVLNTSFNIKGRPILTTIEDAIKVLKTTELDYLFVAIDDESGWLFG